MRRLAGVAVVMALAVGCGKNGGGSPAAPDAAPVTGIAVNGPDLVFLGRTESYNATMTGGSASCSWGDDAPQIGGISANGTFVARDNGTVTIWCDADGVRGTKRVQVIPTYGGQWIGSYRITGCAETGDFQSAGVCAELFNGRVNPLSGSFSQSGAVATGSFTLGTITAPAVSAAVGPDGAMSMSQTHDGTGSITLRSQWRVRQVEDGKITGQVTLTFTADGVVGSATAQGEVFNTNRSASASARARLAPHSAPIRTFGDLLRGLRR